MDLTLTALLCFAVGTIRIHALITSESAGKKFLEDYNVIAEIANRESVITDWNYYTNLTKHNLELKTNGSIKFADFQKEAAKNASKFAWKSFTDPATKRMFGKISDIGTSAVNDTAKLRLISDLQAEMTNIYSTGKVCLKDFGKGCLELEPGLTEVMTNSRDYKELLAVWKGWRDATGKKCKTRYAKFAQAMNEAVAFSGFNDTGESWRSAYESSTFEGDVRRIYDELRPLYEQLHAYVRRKLMKQYGKEVFPESGHIPAHLFGNMWSQHWDTIGDLLVPFPDTASRHITSRMKELGFNVTHMFRVAEDFFKSIGFDPLPREFWENSMLKKPADREVVCHASAWDMFNGNDFRIKMCTTVTEESLQTVHHEMGHVMYFLTYKNQQVIFRDGANPGFHEGMADIIGLSFRTPEHLHAIGLLDKVVDNKEGDINFLMKMALSKVAFLPFGYLIDQWRWSVFRGTTPKDKYNTDWWNLRCNFQGISPPVERTEDDFDPAAKFHVVDNTSYIRYFVSYLVQFQWHKALCDEIGYKGPLHRCDVYKNKKAGALLKKMLVLGSSKPWQDAMEAITGQRKMSAEPLIEFFKPLMTWLKEQNKEENIGWSQNCPSVIPGPPSEKNDIGGTSALRSSILGILVFLLVAMLCQMNGL